MGSAEITGEMIQQMKMSGELMTDDLNPMVLSHHIWAFLHHCLSGAAKQVYKSTDRQDGFNVWRKLTLEINSRTECVRHRLRNRCQQVAQAAGNQQVWKCIADWETLYTEYMEAGGSPMEFEDRRGQLLRILPKELRKDLFRRLGDFGSVGALKEWIREQLELEKNWHETDSQSRAKAVGMMENDHPEVMSSDPEEGDMEALFALTEDSSPDEIHAVQQRFRRFAKGAGRGARPTAGKGAGRGGMPARPLPGGGGARSGSARLPGEPGSARCINCGKTGHATQRCPEQRRDPKQRPCFNCGKVGHMKANCPQANKPVHAVVENTVSFGCLEVDGWCQPRRPARTPSGPQRPQPKEMKLGDFVKESAFGRAAKVSRAEGELRATADDSDNEEWIKDFELRHGDVEWLRPKEKGPERREPTQSRPSAAGKWSRRGTPARVEACHLAPLEVVYPEGAELLATRSEPQRAPKYTTLKVALDSGAGSHVVNRRDVPGYRVKPSAMSAAGAAFLAADGGRIPNHGEVEVNMVSVDSQGKPHRIHSRFEAADVTRALWSVGLICDSGLKVQFNSERALVLDGSGQEVCVFDRVNGLYVAEVKVENPIHEDFQRRGS